MRSLGLSLLLCCTCGSDPPAAAQSGAAQQVARRAAAAVASLPPPTPPWRRLVEAWVHPQPIPSLPLIDQNGARFRLGDLAGGHVLVGLIFTHCSVPTACPLTTEKMHAVGKLWRAREAAGETKGERLRLLTLTFDPEVDTPEVLKSYSEAVRQDVPDWIFATGPTELMETELPRMFGVVAGQKGAEGAIAHTVKLVLLGPGLRGLQTWTDNAFEPEDVIDLVLR